MSKERLEVGQLIPTSATAPSSAGIYMPSQGVLGFTASAITVTDPITNVNANVVTGANHTDEHAAMGAQYIVRFPGFVRSLLASLAVSATASRTSNSVTVSATSHGVTTGSAYVGFNFFYPGSASLAAGWYGPITSIPDANTIVFTAAGSNFGSESVNGGAAYTTLTVICNVTIPSGSIRPGAVITSRFLRSGDTTSTTKSLRNVFATRQLGLSSVTTLPVAWHRLSILCDSENGYAVSSQDATSANSMASGAIDFSINQTFSLSGSLSAAGAFLALYSAELEIRNG